ncbi:unnamed protein product [Pylaiella littoralis]
MSRTLGPIGSQAWCFVSDRPSGLCVHLKLPNGEKGSRLAETEIQKAFHPSTPLLYISERTPTARHKEMKAAVPFLALLLAGLLGPAVDATTAATPMADESERSANPAPATGQPGEQKTGAVHLRGSDGKPARVPVISRPMPGAGGKQDITNSGDAELGEVVAFVDRHLKANRRGTTFVLVKAEVQVVAGLRYTLHYEDADGVRKGRVVVVNDKPWLKQRSIEQDHEV